MRSSAGFRSSKGEHRTGLHGRSSGAESGVWSFSRLPYGRQVRVHFHLVLDTSAARRYCLARSTSMIGGSYRHSAGRKGDRMRRYRFVVGSLALTGWQGKRRPSRRHQRSSAGRARQRSSADRSTSARLSRRGRPVGRAEPIQFHALFSKLSMPSYPAKRGMSPIPTPSSFPSRNYNPFKMVGKPPFMIGDPKIVGQADLRFRSRRFQ